MHLVCSKWVEEPDRSEVAPHIAEVMRSNEYEAEIVPYWRPTTCENGVVDEETNWVVRSTSQERTDIHYANELDELYVRKLAVMALENWDEKWAVDDLPSGLIISGWDHTLGETYPE